MTERTAGRVRGVTDQARTGPHRSAIIAGDRVGSVGELAPRVLRLAPVPRAWAWAKPQGDGG